MAKDVGTVKWLDKGYGVEGDGWNGWINDKHYISYGVNLICEWIAHQIPGDVQWFEVDGKLICKASTAEKKLSKSTQE